MWVCKNCETKNYEGENCRKCKKINNKIFKYEVNYFE